MPPTFMENHVCEFRKGERFMSRMMRVLSVVSFAVLLSLAAGFARLSAQSKSGSEPAKAVEALKGLQFRELGPAIMAAAWTISPWSRAIPRLLSWAWLRAGCGRP